MCTRLRCWWRWLLALFLFPLARERCRCIMGHLVLHIAFSVQVCASLPARLGKWTRARVRMRQSSGRRLGEDSLGEAGVLVGPAPARRRLVGQLPRLMADAAHAVGHAVLPLQGEYPSVQPIQAPCGCSVGCGRAAGCLAGGAHEAAAASHCVVTRAQSFHQGLSYWRGES